MAGSEIAEPTYLRKLLNGFALLMAGCCLLSIVVDPYGAFGTPTIPGMTALKTVAIKKPHLSKALRLAHMRPETVIMGSSVANLSLDPENGSWRPEHRPVFNLGLDSSPLDVQRRYLRFALGETKPRLVVLTMTFFDTMPPPAGETNYIEPSQVGGGWGVAGEWLRWAQDVAFCTMSLMAIQDDFATLWRQDEAIPQNQTAAGFDTGAIHLNWLAAEGAGSRVRKADGAIARRLLAWKDDPRPVLDSLGPMIREARQAGADVAILVTPTYADDFEVVRQLGLEDSVAAWRRELVEAAEREGGSGGGEGRVTVWDFRGFDRDTVERLPDGGGGGLAGFYDTVHPRPSLGGRMIAALEGRGDGFGQVLTHENLDVTEAAFRRDQAAWVSTHPAERERVAEVIRTARASP